ncbi:glycosyltransferase involved in cell wall biosynthesis [Cellulosimicrobium cellulans]|uniref:glycosyltransferase family 2 protein n=1 Tax=Cellulosimicrobium cellulans TaxID=1710 RepID=UPI00195C7383|nr:glycosyltransferase [Cellulosimicrobium cellulans]MBM7821011.1 glycosyltransferase involved in cell wall biosynthesis [Cellulosimicrobium cellulans]
MGEVRQTVGDGAVLPSVSVVVATNRGGPFFAEALASVLAQSYPAAELVVVDDGSPDPDALLRIVEDVAQGVASPRPRVVRRAPAGVSAARNAGVAQTSGDLVVFLDDDDRWHPDRLRRHAEVMAARPDVVVSYCGMRTIDADGAELVAADQRAADDRRAVIRGPGVMLPNLVIRRDAFDAVGGFDPEYRQGEDMDLVLRAAARGPFAFVDDVLVDYRHHATNTTRSHRDLATSLRTILRRHRAAALAAGRRDLVVAYDDRLAANERFAWWSAGRAARDAVRERRPAAALGEVVWAVRFAPGAPARRAWAGLRRAPRA